jgi:hypothetical protein
MSEMGQTEKKSVRAYVFRLALELGHCSTQSACLKRANLGSTRALPQAGDVAGLRSNIFDLRHSAASDVQAVVEVRPPCKYPNRLGFSV